MSIWVYIINIAVVLIVAVTFIRSFPERGWPALAFYTVLSNLMAAVSGMLLMAFVPGVFTSALRDLAACMMVMTFIVTCCILVPLSGQAKMLLIEGNSFFHHLLCPVLTFVSYVFLEPHSRLWAVPVAFTFAYGMLMLWLNHKGKVDGPYPFFRVHQQKPLATVVWMAALLAMISVISLGILRIAG